MCYHKSQKYDMEVLADYYSASYTEVMKEVYGPTFHENGYQFLPTPIITAENPGELVFYKWGLIPTWSKDLADALTRRNGTLNCRSEEMFDKPSYRTLYQQGKRCLIPCTGFFETKHLEPGKTKTEKFPHFIYLKDQPLFSLAGLYSHWKDRSTGNTYLTYTVITTRANEFMAKIHNTKLRQPVIIPREYEKDWLNPQLAGEDVLALCEPIKSEQMDAYSISRMIHDPKVNSNIEAVLEREFYPQLNSD